ncbi:type II toxin-antitoxin system antitoxin DNA ADP-ribosyl glycohydrolase DarG [Clostridium sartagoforme]|uniref:type II toxin-antitoxin system antitoxin DNA ADP-ribosyl glycohydrolase DarG n=1 Tax=Clostridium sartagoforme TaxID=84031 RepID=UPI0031E1B36D
MIIYTTGDLLKSQAEVLVNTVNCEGYMGKGIAYQFKLQYPENNMDYVKACKSGNLKVGKLHYFREKGKLIINFPTKDKWRANSKMEYVADGLDELVKLINLLNIKSIAIPPLGSGNGGLIWGEVKQLIEQKLSVISKEIEIYIYEPSKNYISQPTIEPKLSTSALVLMQIKNRLNKFDTLRLQKTAYFLNIFSNQNYFIFKRHKYGPYDNSIAIISKNIKEYQKYHNVKNTEDAYRILYNKIVSDNVETKLAQLNPFIEKAANYVNSIETNHELECLATIVFLISEQKVLSEGEILKHFKEWSADKANRYSDNDILNGIYKLYNSNIIDKTFTGYIVTS